MEKFKGIMTFLLRNQITGKYLRKLRKENLDLMDGRDEEYLSRGLKVRFDWTGGIDKPRVGVVKDHHNLERVPYTSYWPKYLRFLKNNDIPHDIYNAHDSNWMEQSEKFDVVLWRPNSDPASLQEAFSKIYFLETKMNKLCHPHHTELWSYENKIRSYYLFKHYGIPHPNTFITFSKVEALKFIERTEYPIVSKVSTSSGSAGVELIKDRKQARKFIDEIFGIGRETFWKFHKQKGYVYFQDYIGGAEYDLRVISVGDLFFGYYRYPGKGDFRASGSGNIEWKEIPVKALKLAKKVKKAFGTTVLAVDMIPDGKGSYLVIEASIFFRVDDGVELAIEGVSGYYKMSGDRLIFRKGQYWVPELAAREVMKEYLKKME